MDKIRITKILPNPNNPRIILGHKFQKLCDNIRRYPKLLELRPIVLESRKNPMILGGNMRHKALQDIGYTEIPLSWIRYAEDLTDEEKQAFIILDNVGFGEWDLDALANEWSTEQLSNWGVDLPVFDEEKGKEEDNTVTEAKPIYKMEIFFNDKEDQKTVHAYLAGKGYQCNIINN
jgi:hypothetical protein